DETSGEQTPAPEVTDEEATGDPVGEIASAFALLVRGADSSSGPPGATAEKLDPSVLNSAERRPFLADEDDAETELLRTVIVTGLLVSASDEVLEEAALTRAQLEQERIPELDGRLQNLIAGKLKENAYREAKVLSQLRTRFLHSVLEQQAAERARESAEPVEVPLEEPVEVPLEWSELTKEAPRPARRRPPVTERPKLRLAIRVASGLAIAVGLMVGALQFYTPDGIRSTRRLSAAELATISPYLKWAYRDGVGHGTNLVGMLGAEWHSLSFSIKKEEAQAIVDGLQTQGIDQVMLFDTSQALRVHAVGGQLRVPAPGAR
ncbi:MAG: hypothetical protein V3T14_14075, partial [Myxococcota bacterium]